MVLVGEVLLVGNDAKGFRAADGFCELDVAQESSWVVGVRSLHSFDGTS